MRLLRLIPLIAILVGWSASATAQGPPLLVDRSVTVGAGATIAVAFGETVSRAEDRVIPPRLFDERGISRRSANIAYRFFRFSLFDLPQEQFLLVANHEVFGHGGRLRERFDGPISYSIDAPPPYGGGGGSTSFTFDREPSVHELLAVSAAGMEANNVAADIMELRAIANRSFSARDAMRYLGVRLDAASYILGTGDDPEEPGHDVSDFIQTYNELTRAAQVPALAARTLRREAWVSFADPMLAYSIYAIGLYVAVGSTRAAVPTLHLGSIRYLPAVRYRLTPFGTEWAIANHFARDARTIRVDVRSGRSPGASPWGVAVRQSSVTTWRAWRLDLEGDLWRQPPLALDAASPIDLELRWGGEVRARAARPFAHAFGAAADVVIEAALKTNGFTPGEPLAHGPSLRAGVSVPLSAR